MLKIKIAIYPEFFDPITVSHLDLIKRTAALFDKLIVLVVAQNKKNNSISLKDRMALVKLATEDLNNVEIDYWGKFLSDYAELSGACAIVRSVAGFCEFEKNLKLSFLDSCANKNVETVFLPIAPEYRHISSSLVKQLYFADKNIEPLVPKSILLNLTKILSEVKDDCKQHVR